MYQFGNWQLYWLGHDSFRLTRQTANGTNGTTLYIDPFQIQTGPQADYILITHEHYDHFDPESVSRLRRPNTLVIGPESVTAQLDEMAVHLLPGQSHQTADLSVFATAAYNLNKEFHPKADNRLGYILELDGQRLYHAGDTDLIPEMSQLGAIDLALLPVSGTYVMTADEAIEAVKTIKPKAAIPMHYGSIIGEQEDAERFKAGASQFTEVIILNKES